MPLPDYDSTKHHIGLSAVGGTLKGYILTGGYRVDPQRFGSSGEFGGQQDQIAPSALDRWTQDDLSGGAFQDNFSNDPAMFADSQNFLPSLIEKSARTVPPFEYFSGPGHVDASTSIGVFSTGGKKIAVVDDDRVRYFNAETGALVESIDPNHAMYAATHDPADNKIYVIAVRDSDNIAILRQVTTGGITNIALFPASAPNNPTGMCVTAGRDIVAAMNKTLYLLDVNDARDDATVTRVGRLPGTWRGAVTYNGLTYILLTDGEQLTSLVAWDGTQILPVTEFPYNFLGRSIAVYGGRIYVGGTAADITDADRFAEFYEITGASLRLVKTWATEARAGFTVPKSIWSMAVHEGLLFLGTDKSEFIAYDLTRDALWPGIKVAATHTLAAKNLLSTREKLVAYCLDTTDNTETGFYRIATDDADLSANYDCIIESSDFYPEPDRDKRWSQLRAVCRYDNPTLQASLDGGLTWEAVSGVVSAQSGDLVYTDYDLSALDVSTAIRFRFTFNKAEVAYSELIAFTTTFLFLESGKWGWSFTIHGVDNPENLDGTYPDQDIATLRSTLRGFWTNRTTLTFKDVDGTSYTAFISAMNESQPYIDASGEREAFWAISLTEV